MTQTAERELAAAPEPDGAPPLGQPFTSAYVRLDRLSTVRPDTVVVELSADQPPLLRRPGDLLLPAWTPWGPGVRVLVITTAPVTIRVDVEHLLTLDGESLALVDLDVLVRLAPEEVGPLVAEHGLVLGSGLVLEVQRTVEASARAAVGMSRAQDLRRHGLGQALGDRWLPSTLAEGALIVESVSVARLSWSAGGEPVGPDREDTVTLHRVRPGHSGQAELLAEPEAASPTGMAAPIGQVRPIEQAAPIEQVRPIEPASEHPVKLGLGRLGGDDRHQSSRSADQALSLVHLPAVLSVSVWWIFFTAYWLPELQTVPGARFLLEQLAPLASKELTSAGQAVVTGQGGHSGAPAAILLIASLLLAPLARSRYWLARLALWPITYVAAVAASVGVLGVLLRGRLLEDLVGVGLILVWVYAAVVTTWHSLWVDLDSLPRRPSDVAWLLGLFALVGTAPVALGRAVFAPQLREAALGVADNAATMRWAALLTPATAWVYASGVLLGVLVWAAYLLWPPRQVRLVRWPAAALLVALLALALVGPEASRAAARQTDAMRTQSPGAQLSSCGAWTRQSAGQPVHTLVASGFGCQHLTSFRGYVETSHRQAGVRLAPLRARTIIGDRLEGRLVAAQYDDVVVVAATDRADRRPTSLIGLRLTDTSELWRVACRPEGLVKVRFAGATGGDDPAAGRQTGRNERPTVVLDCAGDVLRVEPRTGRVG